MKKRVKNCRLKYSIHITKAQNKTSGTMKTNHNYVSFRFFDYIILVYDIIKTTCFFFRKKKADFSKQRSGHISPVVDAY